MLPLRSSAIDSYSKELCQRRGWVVWACFMLTIIWAMGIEPPRLAAQENVRFTDAQVKQRVEEILKQMTLEEKIGQLTQIGQYVPDKLKPEDRIRRGEVGSVLWLSDTQEINRLQHVAMDESRLHIPLLFGLDVISGFHTIFPVPLAMAASWDPALVEKEQMLAAREASAAGIRWTFSPMVDIARDPRWGRIVEGAGEDPFLGAAMARAQVRGFQGPYVGSPEHILACAKHFAGYGAADGGRDYDSSYVSEDLMRNVYLPPFHAAVEAGAATLMSAYMDLNDVPATGNHWLLRDVLRHDWGFQGFVVSDAVAVGSLVTHGFARDPKDAAYRALTAGVNMDMASRTYLDHLGQLVKEGKISESLIEEMVRPILAAKIRLGLFEHPYVDESRVDAVLHAPEQQEFARLAAQRVMVLLRNENHTLPLSKDVSSIAVIGPLADTQSDLLGSWGAWIGDTKNVVTVQQAIRKKVSSGTRVEFAKGPDIRRDIPALFDDLTPGKKPPVQSPAEAEEQFNKAIETARRCDVAILVLGELGNMSGEDASRSSLDLSGGQERLLEAIAALGKPVVLVLVSGRPLTIPWADEHIPAIVEAWYPGSQGGNAIADVLFGDANPGGKLPVSWPRSVGQVPVYYAHNLTHQPETEKGFKSRYWDGLSSPLYPFGYGLSYTQFSFSNLQLSRTEMKLGESLEASVEVQNTGGRAGDEVVQLYIHQQAGSASRPMRELKGFERVSLAPGEKKTVHFTLGKNELRFWSAAEGKWVEEPEHFDVWVGEDSTAELHATFYVIP